MTDAPRPTAYVGLFWLDSTQTITHTICSLEKANVIVAASDYLVELRVPEAGYEAFLLQRLTEWDGSGCHVTTLACGKLVMFASEMQGEDIAPTLHPMREQRL
jgi:hypothetical protein